MKASLIFQLILHCFSSEMQEISSLLIIFRFIDTYPCVFYNPAILCFPMKIAVFHELPLGGGRNAVNAIAFELKKRHTVDLYYIDERKNQDEKVNFTHTFFYQFLPKIWQGKN